MPFLLKLLQHEEEVGLPRIREQAESFVLSLGRRCGQRSVSWALTRLKQAGLVANNRGLWRPTVEGKGTEYTEEQAKRFVEDCKAAGAMARKARPISRPVFLSKT